MSEPTNDRSNPKFVWARRPQSVVPNWLYLFSHPATVSKWLDMSSRAKMGEYWGLVHGNFPPNPDFEVQIDGTAGLRRPSAIYQGVKRPLHDGTVSCDKDILVFVTNPEFTYSIRHGKAGEIIEAVQKPNDSVFTTFVTLHPASVEAATAEMPQPQPVPIEGLVLFWEWTEASKIDPKLPFDFEARYDRRLL